MRSSALLRTLATVTLVLAVAAFFTGSTPTLANDDHGDYRFSATSTDIGSGAISGVIDSTSVLFDVDYFSFPARRGVIYSVVLDLVSVDDARVNIVNSLARGSGSSPGQAISQSGSQTTIEWVARTTDTYYVEVAGAIDPDDGSYLLGAYTLGVFEDTSLRDRHSETRDGSTQIVVDNVYQGAISPWTNQPSLTGTLHGGDDADYFSFEARRGVRYTLEIDLGSSEGVEIAFAKPFDGIEKSSDGVGSTLSWIAPSTATYYVAISGTNRVRDSSGTYALKMRSETELQDQHSETRDGATVISFGNAHQGSISPSTDSDYFSFTAERGIRYTMAIDLGTAAGVALTALDTGGQLLATNGGVGTTLQWSAPTTGTHLAIVSASTQFPDVIGTYSLNLASEPSLRDRHGESVDTATPVSLGNAHQGAISPETDSDYFSFTAERGIRYTMTADLGTVSGVTLSALDTSGQLLATNGGVGTTLEWSAQTAGTYLAVVSAANQLLDVIGTYSLNLTSDPSLRDRHGEAVNTATSVSLGNAHQGAISPNTDLDYFSIPAERGVNYSVSVELGTTDGAVISIENAQGETVATTGGVGTELGWTAPSSGNFYAVVSHSPRALEGVGTYALTVEANTSLEDRHPDSALLSTPISFGTVYQAAISPDTDRDFFSFPADRGVEYTFDLTYGTAEAVTLSVNAINAGAESATRNFGEANVLRWIAPATQTYYVDVSASPKIDDPTGTYSLKVTPEASLRDRHSDDIVTSTRIGFGNAIAGAISPADDYDRFFFQAEAGVNYTVDVRPGTVEAVRLSVENAQADFSVSNFGLGNSLDWTAPATGGYILTVSASGRVGNPIGTYQIAVTPEGDARPPVPSTPVPAPLPAPQPVIVGPDDTALIVESRRAAPGSTVKIPVMLNKAQEISSLGFNLHYDPNVLRIVEVFKGSRLSDTTFSHDANVPGVIRFGFAVATSLVEGGSAAVVEFEVIGADGSVSPLTLSDALVSHTSANPLEVRLVGGDLTVGQRTVGDGDGDGEITALDALIALKEASQSTGQYPSLDVNLDGQVTEADARLILILARPG